MALRIKMRSRFYRWKYPHVFEKEKKLLLEQGQHNHLQLPTSDISNSTLVAFKARVTRKSPLRVKFLHKRVGSFLLRLTHGFISHRLFSLEYSKKTPSFSSYTRSLIKLPIQEDSKFRRFATRRYRRFTQNLSNDHRGRTFLNLRLLARLSLPRFNLPAHQTYAHYYLKTVARIKRWLSNHSYNKNLRFFKLIYHRRYAKRRRGLFPAKNIKYYYSVIKFIQVLYGFAGLYQVRSFIRKALYCYKVCKFYKFYSLLESRLATVLVRAGYSSNYLYVDYLLRNRFISVNGKTVLARNFTVRVGDLINNKQFAYPFIKSNQRPFQKQVVANSVIPIFKNSKISTTDNFHHLHEFSIHLLNSLNGYRLNLRVFHYFSGITGIWFFFFGTSGLACLKYSRFRTFSNHIRGLLDIVPTVRYKWRFDTTRLITSKMLNFENQSKNKVRLYFWKSKRYGSLFYFSNKVGHLFKKLVSWCWLIPHKHSSISYKFRYRRLKNNRFYRKGTSLYPVNTHSSSILKSTILLGVPNISTFRLPHPVYKKKKFSIALLHSVFNRLNKT